MTTRSGDAPVMPSTSTQWRTAINATVAVSRMRSSSSKKATEFQNQSGPRSNYHNTHCQASHNVEANQAAPLDRNALDGDTLDRKLKDKLNPEVKVMELVRNELVKQLDAYGLVLVLLAGISFLAILQPPGSFDDGKLQESLLVSLYMLLSTLSFFIACTGLGAVMVGCAELFRPFFYNKIAKYTAVLSESKRYLQPEGNGSSCTESTPRQACFGKGWLGCWEVGPHSAAVDDIHVLAKLCLDNVYRIWRIRLYLGVALVLCIAAYICGALAVMVNNDCQRYMLIGAMAVGGVIVLYEICSTVLSAGMEPVPKSTDGPSSETKFFQGLCEFTTLSAIAGGSLSRTDATL